MTNTPLPHLPTVLAFTELAAQTKQPYQLPPSTAGITDEESPYHCTTSPMHINDFPYEVLSKILEEVTKAHIRDGPTYTFGLSQAPLPLQKATLQRYVRGPVPPELLKWDATSMIRSVCWKWHEWALEHSLKDVYIRRWKGGEVRASRTLPADMILMSCRGGQNCPIDVRATHCTSLLTGPRAPPSTATPSPLSNGP
jgi:hypothetical protein